MFCHGVSPADTVQKFVVSHFAVCSLLRRALLAFVTVGRLNLKQRMQASQERGEPENNTESESKAFVECHDGWLISRLSENESLVKMKVGLSRCMQLSNYHLDGIPLIRCEVCSRLTECLGSRQPSHMSFERSLSCYVCALLEYGWGKHVYTVVVQEFGILRENWWRNTNNKVETIHSIASVRGVMREHLWSVNEKSCEHNHTSHAVKCGEKTQPPRCCTPLCFSFPAPCR